MPKQPLTQEQFQALRAKGLTTQQIVKFSQGQVPDGTGNSKFNAPPVREDFGDQPSYNAAHNAWRQQGSQAAGQTLGENVSVPSTNTSSYFAGQVPGAVVKTAIGGPVKLGISGYEGVKQTIKTGGAENASGQTYHVPILGNMQSFQTEAVNRANEGQNPIWNTLQGALEVGSAGADTVGLAKGAAKLPELASKVRTILADKAAVSADQKSVKSIWEMIKPNLTPTEQVQAVKEGRIVSDGTLGTITHLPSDHEVQMIAAAKPYVTPAKNELEAVANMKDGISTEATALKDSLDKTGATFTKSQVIGKLNKLEEPTLVSSDATLQRAYTLVKKKAIDLTPEGGKLGDLLQVRKDFDTFIDKQFPNLYSSEQLTPMKSAIKDVRNALNDVIDERLAGNINPKGEELGQTINRLDRQYQANPSPANLKALNSAKTAYKEAANSQIDKLSSTNFRAALKRQSLLYDAIDNTASKVPKVGSNVVKEFAKAHPNVIKGLKYGGAAIGLGEVGKHVLP